ncbi:MAG: ABC transporter ATP-binding protein [Aestuariivirga sp.]
MTHLASASTLRVEDLTWGPQGASPIIRDISFTVRPGERLAIIGPNGAGKSSLLRCLYRMNQPTRGTITLDGSDIWGMKPREVARKVAAVLQETPSDFPFTVADIVRTGRIPHSTFVSATSDLDAEKIAHALEHVGMNSFRDRLFSSLSGGEKQRVFVARALAQDPTLLILDEPTNHLDIRHQLEVLRLVRDLGITVITTLHDINHAANFADKVAILADGQLVDWGKPSIVLTNEAISRAFGVQANQYTVSIGPGPHFFFSLPRNARQERQQ